MKNVVVFGICGRMGRSISKELIKILEASGISKSIALNISIVIVVAIAVGLAVLLDKILYSVGKRILSKAVKKTKSNWDDILIERKVFNRLAYLAPAYAFHLLLPYALDAYPDFVDMFLRAIEIYTIIIVLLVSLAFLNSILHIYSNYEISKSPVIIKKRIHLNKGK